MKLPQILYLGFMGLILLVAANCHGKDASKYNFWSSLVCVIILIGLVWWGGFFK